MAAQRPRPARDVRLLAGAVGLSALGDWLALVPLLLLVEAKTGSGFGVAAVLAALWSPSVVLAGAAGWIADRVESRRLLLVSALVAAAACAGLAAADGLAAILVLTGVLGCANALANPAEFALLPAAAGQEGMARANGLVETARYTGVALGPVVGGLLAAGGATSIALLVDAGSFLAFAGVAWLLRARRHPVPAAHDAPPERARDGIAFLLSDDALALVMAAAFVSLLFMTASWTAEVSFTTDVLDAGETGYGAFLTLWTVGMALGALLASRFKGSGTLVAGALAAIVVQGAGLALPTVWLVIPLALAAALLGGVGHGVKNVLIRTLIHERVPERLHGRASAAYNGLRNAAELAALALGGLLVAGVGPRWTLVVAGVLPMLAGLLALARRLAAGDRLQTALAGA